MSRCSGCTVFKLILDVVASMLARKALVIQKVVHIFARVNRGQQVTIAARGSLVLLQVVIMTTDDVEW